MHPSNNTLEVNNQETRENFFVHDLWKFQVFKFFGLSMHHKVDYFLKMHTSQTKGLDWRQTSEYDNSWKREVSWCKVLKQKQIIITISKKEEFRRHTGTARLLLSSGGSSSQWKRFSTKGNIDTNALHLTCRLEIALVLPLNYSCCHRLWLTGDAVQWRMHNLKTSTCYNALVEASLLRICLAYVVKNQRKPRQI